MIEIPEWVSNNLDTIKFFTTNLSYFATALTLHSTPLNTKKIIKAVLAITIYFFSSLPAYYTLSNMQFGAVITITCFILIMLIELDFKNSKTQVKTLSYLPHKIS